MLLASDTDPNLQHLKWQLVNATLDLKLELLARAIKAGFNPAQPRDPRGRWSGLGSEFPGATPAQRVHLDVASRRADETIRRVREHDPKWRPTPSLSESIEGAIRAREAEARKARERFIELQNAGVCPGTFAGESIAARGPGRDFTV